MRPTVRTTAPPTDVLATVEEATAYVGVATEDDVQAHLDAAHELVDGPRSMTRRCFRRRTFEAAFSGWVPSGWCRYLPGGPVLRILSASYERTRGGMTLIPGAPVVATRGDNALFSLGARPLDAQPGGRVVVSVESGPAEPDAREAAKRAVLDVCASYYRYPGLLIDEAVHRSPIVLRFLERWELSDSQLPEGAAPWPS